MTPEDAQTHSEPTEAGLPRPRRDARWRWSRPKRAVATGGVLVAVLGLGVASGATAGGATTSSGNSGTAGSSGTAAHAPPGGMGRPTVSGKITALDGDDITVGTKANSSVTVVASSSTTFRTFNASSIGGAGTTTTISALKVGDVVGVTGTTNSDGTVTATTVMVGHPPRMSKGGPGRGGTPPSGKPSGTGGTAGGEAPGA